jgi:hypothetical protein
MVLFGGYGFAPVAMALSFVADNCDRQKRSGGDNLPLPITPKFPKAVRTEGRQ